MHGMHTRVPKHFVLEERLERYADALEPAPRQWRGLWAEACHPLDPAHPGQNYREVRLDMGCGKGTFTVEAARREPDVLFVGIDYEPLCLAYAAQRAIEAGTKNVIFVPARGDEVSELFAPGELALVYLNFPTPFPRSKRASLRLTHLDRLMDYRKVLAPGGAVQLKTDSQPLRDFTLTQLQIAGYRVVWSTDDCRTGLPDDPVTGYEARLTAKGASVFGIRAVPGPVPEHVVQTAKLSLVDYLPQDLSTMGYIPHGMERTVTNLRNLEAKGKERDLAAQSRRMQAGREAARKAGHAASGGQTGHTGRQA